MFRVNNQKGTTLVELMMSVTISGLIIFVAMSFFGRSHAVFTQVDVNNTMKTNGQREIGRLGRVISLNKRIFSGGSANDLAFLARINFGSDPVPKASSKLPQISVSGVLSPNESGFDPQIFGNSLFFATFGQPVVAINILDSSGAAHNVRIDTYSFQYYYINLSQNQAFRGQGGRNRLVGWHSQPYADYSQISRLTDTVEKENLVIYLYNAGYRFAWLPSAAQVTNAFFRINSNGTTPAHSTHLITKGSIEFPLDVVTGVSGWSFPVGIAFNSGPSFAIKIPVPVFAQANNDFPGGLEIAVTGANTGRKIFMRLVLASQASTGLQSYEHINMTTVRDCW
ncbi:MAG: prepilin-type N-terminal cleavage/methylation domain-containing protein [bacterium]|nr:prepilin-type N-terminal cleavage/methylation domain-containing protein [bacterium]MDD5755880.1 prepilin-type N-terminal cleavage/methylation domain-containing protein [bacterium]